MFAGKNVFSNVGSDKLKRRPSQFDRAVHRIYHEPRSPFSSSFANRFYHRAYWAFRAIQFKIFFKNEELDIDDVADKYEAVLQPPSLQELAEKSNFDSRWIKYMYSRFKNECPSGRMKETEFRVLLASLIAAEKATNQYISRLFAAFSEDQKTITFQNLIDCLSSLHPATAEANAQWTIRLITGSYQNLVAYPEFLTFTQAVFALSEGKGNPADSSRETVQQRAADVFAKLDSDNDGYVTRDDLINFFKNHEASTANMMHKEADISECNSNGHTS